jgi:hypothetical protein
MVAPVVRLGASRTPIAHSPLQRAKEHRIQDGAEPSERCIGQQFLRPLKRACGAQPLRGGLRLSGMNPRPTSQALIQSLIGATRSKTHFSQIAGVCGIGVCDGLYDESRQCPSGYSSVVD